MALFSFYNKIRRKIKKTIDRKGLVTSSESSNIQPLDNLVVDPDLFALKECLLGVVGKWSASEQELRDWDRVAAEVKRESSNLISAANDLDVPFSQGFWMLTIGNVVFQLESVPLPYLEYQARCYHMLDAPEPVSEQGGFICDLLVTIKLIIERGLGSALGPDDIEVILNFISTLESQSDTYNVLIWFCTSLALADELNPAHFDLAGCARLALRFKESAVAGGKAKEIAFAAVTQAVVSIAEADDKTSLQQQAFRDCWVAIEHLRLADKVSREILTAILVVKIKDREYISALQLYFVHDFDLALAPPEIREYVGTEWPPRISAATPEQQRFWIDYLFKLQPLEFELVNIQDSLLPVPTPEAITVDWRDWRFEYAAYRRAVPHNQSLLRERYFNRIVLDLAHEITHVLSLMGALGVILCIHRIQIVHAWIALWALDSESVTEATIINNGGVPYLKSDDSSLRIAAVGLQAPLEKARLIQDVWTVWLEGLAVFCETAGDPAGDSATINDVMLALRNFVDVLETSDNFDAAFRNHVQEFEALVSKAMREASVDRLYMFMEARETPYLAGYLIVRGIVSSWRKTTNSPLSGSKCLQLLLHATRILPWDITPSLSEPLVAGTASTLLSFSAFLKILLALPAEDILAFTTQYDPDTSPDSFRWVGGRLLRWSKSDAEAQSEIRAIIQSRFDEIQRLHEETVEVALSSNAGRDKSLDDAAVMLARELSSYDVGEAEEHLYSLLGKLSLLPVGTVHAPFTVAVTHTGDRDVARLTVSIKTTETHRDDGKPSMNAMSIPISMQDAELIKEHHASSGEPTIRITRVIVLDSSYIPDSLEYMHLFWLEYGPWKSIESLNLASQVLLETASDAGVLENLLKRRLSPNPLQVIEEDVVANGEALMEKLKGWVDRSPTRTLSDDSDFDGLAGYIGASATAFLAPNGRKLTQRDAARVGMVTVYGNEVWIPQVVQETFANITTFINPSARIPILTALTMTGRVPGESAELEKWNEEISRILPLFEKGPLGWDVRTSRSNGDQSWNL
ncbi:hypothetical protein V7799_18030 [Rhizobium laguerreae]